MPCTTPSSSRTARSTPRSPADRSTKAGGGERRAFQRAIGPDHAQCEQAMNTYPDKKRPPLLTGAKLPWFSRVSRAWLAAGRLGEPPGAEKSLGGVAARV